MGPKALPIRERRLGAYKSPIVQDVVGIGDYRREKELLANTQQGYGDAARDDWLDTFGLGVDVVLHKPNEDMVGSP